MFASALFSPVVALAIYARAVTAAPAVTARAATDAAVVWMCLNQGDDNTCQAQAFELGKCGQLSNSYAGNVYKIQDISAISSTSPIKCLWYLTDDCSGDSYDNQDDEKLTDGNGDFAKTRSAMCNPST